MVLCFLPARLAGFSFGSTATNITAYGKGPPRYSTLIGSGGGTTSDIAIATTAIDNRPMTMMNQVPAV